MSATEERTFRTKAPYHGDRVPTLFHLRQHVREALDRASAEQNKTLSALGEELLVPGLVGAGLLPAQEEANPATPDRETTPQTS